LVAASGVSFSSAPGKKLKALNAWPFCNRTNTKAEELPLRFKVPRVYDDTENTGDDDFETVKLVWAAYESANTGKVVGLKDF
jgi:hypothetical protein